MRKLCESVKLHTRGFAMTSQIPSAITHHIPFKQETSKRIQPILVVTFQILPTVDDGHGGAVGNTHVGGMLLL